MIQASVIVATLVSLLEKLADLLIHWRISQGTKITGAPSASILDRVGAVVDKWGSTEFPGMTPEQANRERRNAVLDELKEIGIDVGEKYARWLIESVLIRKQADS